MYSYVTNDRREPREPARENHWPCTHLGATLDGRKYRGQRRLREIKRVA